METLSDERKHELFYAARDAVNFVRARLEGKHMDKGGFFRAYQYPRMSSNYADLIPLWAAWVGGDSNRHDLSKYEIISFEKAVRLAIRYKEFGGAMSSMQADRNPEKGQYGGAVILRVIPGAGERQMRILLSFSGLPEMADEAAMLLTPLLAEGWAVSRNDIACILEDRHPDIVNELAQSIYDNQQFKMEFV